MGANGVSLSGLPRAATTPCTADGSGAVAPARVSRVLGPCAGWEGGWQRQDWQYRREAPRGLDRDRSQDRGGEGGWRQGREGSAYGRPRHDDRQHAGWEWESGARSRDARDWAEPRNADRGRERDRSREPDRGSERYGDRGYAHSDRGGLFSRVDQAIHPPPATDMEHARERGARRPMWAEDGMQVLRAVQRHSVPRYRTRVHAHSVHACTHAPQHTSTLPQRKHWNTNTWTHTVAL